MPASHLTSTRVFMRDIHFPYSFSFSDAGVILMLHQIELNDAGIILSSIYFIFFFQTFPLQELNINWNGTEKFREHFVAVFNVN